MDTVKVDVQKLQILNDRISQCLEALNQVRLSVHGLQQGLGGFQQPGMGGISHTSVNPYNPYGQTFANPWGQGFGSQYGQGFAPQYGQSFSPQIGQGFGQWGQPYGISHSPWTQVNPLLQLQMQSDPFIAARIAQTFPYAYTPVTQYGQY